MALTALLKSRSTSQERRIHTLDEVRARISANVVRACFRTLGRACPYVHFIFFFSGSTLIARTGVEIGWLSKFDFLHLIGNKYHAQVNKHIFYYPSIAEMCNLHDESRMWKKYKSLVVSDVMTSRDCRRQRKQNTTSRPSCKSTRLLSSKVAQAKGHVPTQKAAILQTLQHSGSTALFHNKDIVKVMGGGDGSPMSSVVKKSMVVISSGPTQLRKPIDMIPMKGETPLDENQYWSSNPISTGMKFIPQKPSLLLVRKQPEANMGPRSSTKGHSFGSSLRQNLHLGAAHDIKW